MLRDEEARRRDVELKLQQTMVDLQTAQAKLREPSVSVTAFVASFANGVGISVDVKATSEAVYDVNVQKVVPTSKGGELLMEIKPESELPNPMKFKQNRRFTIQVLESSVPLNGHYGKLLVLTGNRQIAEFAGDDMKRLIDELNTKLTTFKIVRRQRSI